jgi:FAD/FMN-containing dehydrogenase
VSTRRLDSIDSIDHLSGQLTVGSGATLGDVQRHAAAAGWEYGVDLAARDTATIGGTVATNAGGIRVIANGMTRAQLVGIEAVLADGSVISHLGGMLKDNTGYDLASLLCGSEGTLGIITAVRLRLHRPAGATSVGFIGVSSYADALSLVEVARSGGARVLAAEILDETSMDRVCEAFNLPWPFRARVPYALLFELADGGDGSGFENLAEHPAVLGDLVVALQARDRERLWEYREKQAEAFSELGVFHNLDVSVPLPRLAECAEQLRAQAAAMPGVIAYGVFGHLADGNLHVAIVDGDPDSYAVDRAVLECVARFEGSISAEHGVGRVKAAELHLCRTPAEIGAMRSIKAALDPAGLMNPGVIFS